MSRKAIRGRPNLARSCLGLRPSAPAHRAPALPADVVGLRPSPFITRACRARPLSYPASGSGPHRCRAPALIAVGLRPSPFQHRALALLLCVLLARAPALHLPTLRDRTGRAPRQQPSSAFRPQAPRSPSLPTLTTWWNTAGYRTRSQAAHQSGSARLVGAPTQAASHLRASGS